MTYICNNKQPKHRTMTQLNETMKEYYRQQEVEKKNNTWPEYRLPALAVSFVTIMTILALFV